MKRDYKPKPAHLSEGYAKQFQDNSVVQAYRYRGTYPSEVFTTLFGLIDPSSPQIVLDIGCGRGEIARELVDMVDRVDAVDFSLPMIKTGKTLKNGNHPNLHWVCSKAEEAPYNPPYALITAGNSLHWMDWYKLMPIMNSVLTPTGKFAIVSVGNGATPWGNSELDLIREFSTNRDFKPYNLIDELEKRKLFKVEGSHETTPVPFTQTIDEYIGSFHSKNGFSRERMTSYAAKEFDNRIQELITPYAVGEKLNLVTIASIVWGRPTS